MKCVAKFEKVSFEEFAKSVRKNEEFIDFSKVDERFREPLERKLSEKGIKHYYDLIELPKRATEGSAGYDFTSPLPIKVETNLKMTCFEGGMVYWTKSALFPTGVRCKIDNGYVLKLYPRSSVGIKKGLTLANSVGIIDSDYYFADNEGHIHFAFNNGTDKPIYLDQGEKIMQGLLEEFFVAAGDDELEKKIRTGGFGSTNN